MMIRYIKSRLIGISEVKVIKNNKVEYSTFRFFIIRFLKYVNSFISNLIDRLDYKIDKAHILKNYYEGQKNIIVDRDELTLKDLVEVSKEIDEHKDDLIGKTVFMRFDISCPKNGKIDMKDYLFKYKDTKGIYGHTLNNILEFNDTVVNQDADVNIRVFCSGRIIQKTYSYNDVRHKHLVDFENPAS